MGWGGAGTGGEQTAAAPCKLQSRTWLSALGGLGLQLQLVALALFLFLLCPILISRASLERCGCGTYGAWRKPG